MNICHWYLLIYCHYLKAGPDRSADPTWLEFYRGMLQRQPYSYEYDYRGGHAISWKSFGKSPELTKLGKEINFA